MAVADRDLLFGILALQNDFITRDALVTAFGVWVAAKDRPIGAVLVERGELDEPLRRVLETLVDAHVARHGGDASRSLAAAGSAREALASIADGDVRASLASLTPSGRGASDSVGTEAGASGDGAPWLRFRVLHFHAKGGLGRVSVALDRELGRQVAYKEIQDFHADDPASRGRFLLEAEITGGLEHPGIVPVYSLGRDPTGRPYYAMRFIRGEDLGRTIERFHGAGSDHASVAFRDLLGRLLDVCDAIAYAHDRGVLHRDLKPGNIMLGRYGETLVVDWGLARLVDGPLEASSDEGPLRPSSAGSSEGTVAGSAVGTPGFMSPEQAEGRLDLLGPATDVYALGATLYALSTGKAAFDDVDKEARLAKTRAGDFAAPRSIRPGLPRALEAVCLKAMALRPADRFADVRALADDLKRWLADEPVTAWREPWSIRSRRWVAKHRTAVSTATVGTLLVLIVGGAALVRERIRDARDRERTGLVVRQVEAADDATLPDLVRQAAMLRPGIDGSLRTLWEGSAPGDRARWNAAVALAAVEPSARVEVLDRALSDAATAGDLGALAEAARELGEPFRARLQEGLRRPPGLAGLGDWLRALAIVGPEGPGPVTELARALGTARKADARYALGNVWEWCHDPYRPDATAEALPGTRICRGGSFAEPAAFARSAPRNYYDPRIRNSNIGFRLARTLSD